MRGAQGLVRSTIPATVTFVNSTVNTVSTVSTVTIPTTASISPNITIATPLDVQIFLCKIQFERKEIYSKFTSLRRNSANKYFRKFSQDSWVDFEIFPRENYNNRGGGIISRILEIVTSFP